MLQFQEKFFNQEIRDGFYIDATMKSLWAAELEVLQKVAEICDRHGITWYAAYGTLLGAIRHEGFVPWDDDIDIWVKRPDYNRLLKILPKELPKGYRISSPMIGEGNDQFHTCIHNGKWISTEEEWLRQYHGCPFVVGLDIFPLDYLARNEEDRFLQEQLITIAARGAQVCSGLYRGGYNKAKDSTKEKKAMLEEVQEGIQYLEANCGINIDHQLFELEKWYALASEFGKWANYFAMMYEETESDFLIFPVEYICWPVLKYPKEWFADTYSADFENFMLPVPCGYEQILRRCYGDYEVVIKKAGAHEYPYYVDQLRTLRKVAQDGGEQAEILAQIASDAIQGLPAEISLPPDWETKVWKSDGKRKELILCANDIQIFLAYGEKALDKLEELLKAFEMAQEQVALWWRPQRNMVDRLRAISLKLSERYQKILEGYRNAGWGICDETDNIDRAVEVCDVYYGNMNGILQPFQNAGKPIMIADMGENHATENADRINEFRAFLSFTDYEEHAGKIYFANTNYNALSIVDKATYTIMKMIPFEEAEPIAQNMHLRCIKKEGRICFLPTGMQCVHIYDIDEDVQYICHFSEDSGTETLQGSWDYFLSGDQVYLLPCHGRQGLWIWNVSENAIERETWWDLPHMEGILRHGNIDEKHFYSFEVSGNRLYITNVATQNVETHILPDERVTYIAYDGRNFWYTIDNCPDIVCWNNVQGIVDKYQIKGEHYWERESMFYRGIYYAEGMLFLFLQSDHSLYVLDRDKREIVKIHSVKCMRGAFRIEEEEPNFKCDNGKLICLLKNAGEVILVDLKTLEIKQYNEDFHISDDIRRYAYEIALRRNALLYEEKGMVELEMLYKLKD